MLLGAFLPWSLLALAICAQRAGTPSSLTDLVRDVLPDGLLTRWSASFPVLAFTSGLLLAFALVEPRVVQREPAPELARPEDAEERAQPLAAATA
jgi:hypothetical protein